MKTIKQSVFRELSNKFSGNEFTRKDIQKAVWNAQGFNADEFAYRQGYYGINIKSWNDGGRRSSCFLEILETHFMTKYLQIGPRT